MNEERVRKSRKSPAERPATRTNPRIQARRVLVAREHGKRRRRRIIAGFVMIGLVVAGVEVVHSSVLGARHVRVSGAANIPESTIIKVAGLESAPPLVDLDTAVIAMRLERLPWIALAKVSIAWPSTVTIDVTERTPVDVIADPPARRHGDSGSWAVTDSTGRILEVVASQPASLPVIAAPSVGPGSGGVAAGGRQSYLPGSYLPAPLRSLPIAAASLPQSMVPETQEITTSSDGIVMVMTHNRVAIIGNTDSLRQKFVSLATVLARADLNSVSAIDLRAPAAPVLLAKGSSPIVAGHVGG